MTVYQSKYFSILRNYSATNRFVSYPFVRNSVFSGLPGVKNVLCAHRHQTGMSQGGPAGRFWRQPHHQHYCKLFRWANKLDKVFIAQWQSWALSVFFNFFNNIKWFYCIFDQINNLCLHQSYLKSPLQVKLTC